MLSQYTQLHGRPEVPQNCLDVTVGSPLEGSPWHDIESDPAVFTSLAEKIGIKGVEVEEVFDLGDEFIDSIGETFGLIFLFKWRDKDTEEADQRRAMTNIPPELFFMNQVIQNACGTQALLSIAFNCPRIKLSQELRYFKRFCLPLSPPMRGFALTNCHAIRTAHNSFGRQTDLPVLEYYVPEPPKPEPKKSSKKKGKRGKKRKREDSEEEAEKQVVEEEIFHFICYVPVNGTIWEIDGLKRTPKDRGRVRNAKNWIKDVRPVIRKRMADYDDQAIAFNLMALVPDRRELLNAEEAEITAVEDAAKSKLQALDTEAADRMNVDVTAGGDPSAPLPSRRDIARMKSVPELLKVLEVVEAKKRDLVRRRAEETEKRERYRVENVRRRYDYTPFMKKFLSLLHQKGKLNKIPHYA
ncbi:hypothetical protein HK104_001069 [Borealophlyctis nickersoniae]|nr:hypothetical protein HK104_001069 [Borealophlyctis nickersoniae]